MHMFQCWSLCSSHPLLPPLCPQVCSLCLHLPYCSANRLIGTIFLHSFSSVHFSRSVVSDSLGPHGLQHTRLPCPTPTPTVYSNSCPSSRWCHPTISSSVIPFSSCPQSFPASGSFPMSPFFTSGGQSIGGKVLELIIRHYYIKDRLFDLGKPVFIFTSYQNKGHWGYTEILRAVESDASVLF